MRAKETAVNIYSCSPSPAIVLRAHRISLDVMTFSSIYMISGNRNTATYT